MLYPSSTTLMADNSATPEKRLTKLALILVSAATSVIAVAKLALPYTSTLTSFRGIWVITQLIIILIWKLSAIKCKQEQQHENEFLKPLVLVHDSIENISAAPDDLEAEATFPPAQLTDDEMKQATESIKRLSSIEKCDTIDDTWKAIMDGGSSPVRQPLRKSETWEGETTAVALPRQTPVEGRPELRKSATFMEAPKGTRGAEWTTRQARVVGKPEMKKSATYRERKERGEGLRRREALVMGNDELFGRVEAFIKMHHDHLRMQRQESVEQRRFTGLVSRAY